MVPVIQGALLCDAAHDYNGLVSILGGFVAATHITQLPAPAAVWFAGRVAFGDNEIGEEHRLVVTASAPDGGPLGEVRATLPANAVMSSEHIPEMASGVNLVFPFPFPMMVEGIHWISLTVDDVELIRLPLKVVEGPPPG